jgi:hypothetical protein
MEYVVGQRFVMSEYVPLADDIYDRQLRDWCDLLVCWKPTPNAVPRDVEKGLIREFEAMCSKLPFGNINH